MTSPSESCVPAIASRLSSRPANTPSITAAVTPPPAWPYPLPPGAPLPHRKVIRSWLLPLSDRSTWRAFMLLAIDYLLLTA
ncbi:MAG: fatty acid desaturase, partial [Rhodoferax sp.]|nr:fatty acid desaturase [Rhodoferax sp.]